MTAHQLLESIRDTSIDDNEAYRRLLSFLCHFTDGYGENRGERGAARQYAQDNGYFWLPCVLCGKWMGGHERNFVPGLMLTPCTGHGVCDDCQSEAKRVNALFGHIDR